VVVGLRLVVEVLAHTSLAEGYLMCHTKGINHIIVLVTEEDPRLDWLLGLGSCVMLLPLGRIMHRLSVVHLVHMGLVVHAGLLLA
jgi:hypothetical protein